MNRLLIVSAVAVAAAAVSIPAVAGLANNPSFSHRLPVNVPSKANLVQLDDKGKVVEDGHASGSPTSTRVPSPGRSGHGESEPGDDRGGASDGPTSEPGDDRGRQSSEPGDDRGRESSEPGDDRGRESSEPGDDRGGASSEPGDDSGGHGGGSGKGGHGG